MFHSIQTFLKEHDSNQSTFHLYIGQQVVGHCFDISMTQDQFASYLQKINRKCKIENSCFYKETVSFKNNKQLSIKNNIKTLIANQLSHSLFLNHHLLLVHQQYALNQPTHLHHYNHIEQREVIQIQCMSIPIYFVHILPDKENVESFYVYWVLDKKHIINAIDLYESIFL